MGTDNYYSVKEDVQKYIDGCKTKMNVRTHKVFGRAVLAGMMIMMPVELVRKYHNRIINVHPALIPSFCGKGFYGIRPHEAVLKSGVKVTGATVHFVDEVYDHGAIIMQKAVYVKNGDTPEELQHRVMEEAEWQILPKTIDLIAHGRVKVENGIAVVEE